MTFPDPPVVVARAWLLVATLFCTAASAQDPAWNLPARGFAGYDRETTIWRIAPSQEVRSGGLQRPVDATSAWRVRSWRKAPITDGFQLRDFDDADWRSVRMPLATQKDRGDAGWPQAERVLDGRVLFEVPRRTKAVVLTIEHDDDVTAWLNGVQILQQATDGKRVRTEMVFPYDVLDLLERRPNLLSIQVRNKAGGSRVDVELVASERPFQTPENALARIERDRKEAKRIQGTLFTSWRAPAVLCEGELDPSHEFVALPPVDFRDLGAHVAFDLRRAGRRGGSMGLLVQQSWRLGDIKLKGRAGSIDEAGHQRIVLEVEGVKPDARRYEKRFFEREVLRWWDYSFEGELVVDRWFDAARGVVSRLESRLVGNLIRVSGEDEGRRFEVEFAETWTLDSVRESRDGQFEIDVAEAIQKGGAFLRKYVGNPERDSLKGGGETRTYPSGRLALALLAMIHAEVPRDDEVLLRGLDAMRARVFVDTYSTAHALMAMEAYYMPRGEYEDLRSGVISKPRARNLTDSDMALVREWTAILLDNMDTRVDSAYLARWNYVKGARYDHSVNQYGLLGLYSAHLCGVEISPQIWHGAAAHLVGSQQKPGRKFPFELTTHGQLRAQRGGGSTTTRGVRPTAPAGWSYTEAESNGQPRPVYGSMTCAGLSGLTIALAGLRDAGMTGDTVLTEANEALRMGFAWLSNHFTVRWHPGPGLHASYYSHFYYYLYGLERACELSGVALLNGRDWYQEGALALLARQRRDGSWGGMTGGEYDASTITAMAVLFLKKASMPVYTQR